MSRCARLAVAAGLLVQSLAAWPATAPAQRAARTPAPAAPSMPAAASAPADAASAPIPFTGTLATGVTYVADMGFDSRVLHIWRPTKDVQPGKDVAWTIAWTNLDQFPRLKTAATQVKPQRFLFRVLKTDVLSGSPKLPWMATYRCEILAVEPLPAPAPQSKRRR